MPKPLALGCACAGCCSVLRIVPHEEWDEEPAFASADVYPADHRTMLRHRIRFAWNTLLGRDSWNWNHCLYLEVAQLRELRDYLNYLLDSLEPGTPQDSKSCTESCAGLNP